ncbi:hypothetical protein SAY87_005345 [Trapa incisa]|uniref:Protein kinase domain-containing protein n=1 Tax=Trapa incisa TaxID=236973 RepID=A0AAN7K6A3_9MYRT|nr:hypothetical protein SAY87_005345 [Trapa incisa]
MPPSSSAAVLVLHYLLLPFVFAAVSCSTKANPSLCPPFSSFPPPYPFSASPGCGHPSFFINCSSPHSTLSINHLTFSLLHFEPNSSSLTLTLSDSHSSPSSPSSPSSSRFPSIPSRSISLSGSPFRPSNAFCSRLNNLSPCSHPNATCRRWECELVDSPALLLRDCIPARRPASDQAQRCREDVLEYLNKFLEMGIEVEWDSSDSYFTSCRTCRLNNGVCGYNSLDPKKQFLCFHSQSQISPSWLSRHTHTQLKMLGSILTVACFLLLVSVSVAILRWRFITSSHADEDPTSIILRRHRSLSLLPPVFTYEELESSAGYFNPSCKIGDGGFGSVYLGRLPDGRSVAVKRLHRHLPTAASAVARALSTKSFCNEILILSSMNHPNLVKLHGYCSDPRGLLLVYDYVPNGTLADHLHGCLRHRRAPLTWQVRLDMAVQIGLAIEYLHHSVVDPKIALDGMVKEGVHAVAELAFRCVAADKDDRPDSREVVEELMRIKSKSH